MSPVFCAAVYLLKNIKLLEDIMAFCRNCGKEVSDGAKFCAGCGTPTGVAAGAPAVNNSAGNAPDLRVNRATTKVADDAMDFDELSLFGYFVKCLKNYAVFSGRARRKEAWGFWLFQFILSFVLGIIGLISVEIEGIMNILSLLVGLALLIPDLAVCVRRLHDVGKSGWTMLWCLTLIGAIYPAVMIAFRDSKLGSNLYGKSPKYGEL